MFFPLAILVSEIVLAFLFAMIAQLFYRRMGLDFRSIVKGFAERLFLLVCLSNALPHALAMFGALKVATRLMRKDVEPSDQAAFNDFFLIGNLVSAVAAIGYVRLLQFFFGWIDGSISGVVPRGSFKLDKESHSYMKQLPPVHPDISLARTLDKRFYTEPHWQDAARERIFLPSWQFVGHASDFGPEANCRPLDLLPGCLDEPLLLTHDGEEIRCLSNVCTHRGNILVTGSCRTPHIRCRYHGRVFGLDGGFRSMPEFQGVRDFPSEDDHLPTLPLMRWGDLLFSTLGTHSADRYFAEVMDRLSWLPMDEFRFRPDLSRDFLVKAHWALYCENYLEGFHIPFVHAGLNAVIDYGAYRTECFSWSNLQVGIAKEGETCFDLPDGSPDQGTAVAAYYFFVFPNLMFNFYPWGLSLNIVEPNGISETRVRFLTYVWKEELFDIGAGSGLDTVEMEDEEVVEQVQRGIRSRLYRHGRFSVSREQGPHHFQRMVSACLG